MGAGASKSSTPHVWKGSGPPTVSQDLLEQLQSSPETDTTRAQTLELHVQARVAEELRRLQAEQLAKLQDAERGLTESSSESPSSDNSNNNNTDSSSLSSEAVRAEITGLRARLEARQREVSRPLPAPVGVGGAGGVVTGVASRTVF
ncbi:DUF1690 domain containing protein [Niveomyces insectorum RCEF 264]|uniref:DUF1690 domain containing protein n=1 Tax=Niveomyces insectorum RCEF 264 TaxID=1081102 RepID=A0A167TFM2_9HYPO|nr:DUF1690 domain containing protein [Niveomyces insectorum RCEF 264]